MLNLTAATLVPGLRTRKMPEVIALVTHVIRLHTACRNSLLRIMIPTRLARAWVPPPAAVPEPRSPATPCTTGSAASATPPPAAVAQTRELQVSPHLPAPRPSRSGRPARPAQRNRAGSAHNLQTGPAIAQAALPSP